MKKLLILIACLSFLSAYAQQDNPMVIGTVDSIHSAILNEERMIYMHVPHGSKGERYPVLYILDGESHFESAVAITDQMSGVIPPVIVVGITNIDREHDLTPTHVNPDRMVNAGDARRSGGGEQFLAFIAKELMPYIESKYPTEPYRIFSGHSLGGLTVVNAFINHTNMFNAYIALDPSVWWDNGRWVEGVEKSLPQYDFSNKSLYVAIANNIIPPLDTLSVLKDTSINTLFPRSVFGLVHALQKTKPQGLHWGYRFYANERHGTVELTAEYGALRYLFNYYSFTSRPFAGHPEISFFNALMDHYKMVSQKLGYTVELTENQANEFAYSCMEQGRWDDAYKLFAMNTEKHPESSNAFDSLGDYYAGKGDKQHAIEAYAKSLSLHETEDTRRKLNEMKK